MAGFISEPVEHRNCVLYIGYTSTSVVHTTLEGKIERSFPFFT